MILILNKKRIWNLFFISKFFYIILSVFFISKYIRLGDSERYLSATTSFSYSIFYHSTAMMDFFGSILGKIPMLGHFVSMTLVIYGIYYSISKFEISNKRLIILLLILSFPTFSIWTSVFSKESIVVFILGIIFGYIVRVHKTSSIKPKLIEIFAFYLLIVFKAQYIIPISETIVLIYIISKKWNISIKALIVISIIILNISLLYIFRDTIDTLSFSMIKHFSLDSMSTRDASFIWSNQYDFFYNIFNGMFIAFVGPTFSEALNKPIQMISFIESIIILIIYIYIFYVSTIYKTKLKIFYFLLIANCFFWFLFLHYPFGVLNPGSALRYRSGFYPFLILILFYFNSKHYKYIRKEVNEKNNNIR